MCDELDTIETLRTEILSTQTSVCVLTEPKSLAKPCVEMPPAPEYKGCSLYPKSREAYNDIYALLCSGPQHTDDHEDGWAVTNTDAPSRDEHEDHLAVTTATKQNEPAKRTSRRCGFIESQDRCYADWLRSIHGSEACAQRV